ncbi:hypothetical protein HDU88_008489 [Geranomyces variabilis]|nr:hypothetical protein HDU88_008489 [Geranomyces variabilis]
MNEPGGLTFARNRVCRQLARLYSTAQGCQGTGFIANRQGDQGFGVRSADMRRWTHGPGTPPAGYLAPDIDSFSSSDESSDLKPMHDGSAMLENVIVTVEDVRELLKTRNVRYIECDHDKVWLVAEWRAAIVAHADLLPRLNFGDIGDAAWQTFVLSSAGNKDLWEAAKAYGKHVTDGMSAAEKKANAAKCFVRTPDAAGTLAALRAHNDTCMIRIGLGIITSEWTFWTSAHLTTDLSARLFQPSETHAVLDQYPDGVHYEGSSMPEPAGSAESQSLQYTLAIGQAASLIERTAHAIWHAMNDFIAAKAEILNEVVHDAFVSFRRQGEGKAAFVADRSTWDISDMTWFLEKAADRNCLVFPLTNTSLFEGEARYTPLPIIRQLRADRNFAAHGKHGARPRASGASRCSDLAVGVVLHNAGVLAALLGSRDPTFDELEAKYQAR